MNARLNQKVVRGELSKMWYGLNGAIKLSESIKRRDAIVERIMQYSSR